MSALGPQAAFVSIQQGCLIANAGGSLVLESCGLDTDARHASGNPARKDGGAT